MLAEPTPKYVAKRIAEFDSNPRYHGAESTVGLVFRQWPRNSVYEQVLAKVVVPNRLYSTNIYDPYTVAQHIIDIKIDERLTAGDLKLVNDVADVTFADKHKTLLSFATKYCSWHQPGHYQIYDGNVDWLLCAYRRKFAFADFKRYELREYPRFHAIVDALRDRFRLRAFNRKRIDKFLWFEATTQ